jgi:hypothetical protein
VGNTEFRSAVIVLTLLAMVSAWLGTVEGKASLSAYLVAGYAFAILLNVFVPHAAVSVVFRTYMQGTATAVLLNLPVTIGLVTRAFREHYIEPHALLVYDTL